VFLSILLLTGPALADLESEITTSLDYFEELWRERDLESIRGYFHPDFVLVSSSGILNRGERIEDLKVIMEPGKDQGELEFFEVQVRSLGDGHALAWGSSKLAFKDGTELVNLFSSVYVNTPFGWKLLMTHN
jgi:hypothetical protein